MDKFLIRDLLNSSKEKYPKLYNFIKEKEPINVMDIGCRVPTNLFILYHTFNCNLLKGVDIESRDECIKKFIEHHLEITSSKQDELKNAKSFFDIYNYYLTPSEDVRKKIESKSEFDEIFVKTFTSESFEDIKVNKKLKFDIVISSNLIHFFLPIEIERTLDKIQKLLNEDGLVILRVQKNQSFQYSYFKKKFNSLYPNGKLFEYYDKEEWRHSIAISHNNLLTT